MTRPASSPPVTIAVVNFNGARYLTACLDAIDLQTHRPAEVLVVDNDSTDGSADEAERRDGVRVVRMGRNLGPGDARNAALREAGTRLVLLMDNDVLLAPECLERLVRAFHSRENVALCQARTLYDDRPDLIQSDGGDIHFLGSMILRHDHRDVSEVPPSVDEVDSAITTAVLCDRVMALESGGFDADFFIYFEDHDWAVRNRLAGHLCLAAGDAVVRHRGGTAELSFRTGGTYTGRRFFLQLRNRWLFILKVYPLHALIVLSPAMALFESFSLVYALKRGFGAQWIAATRYVLSHLGDIRSRRRQLEAVRRIPLGSILRTARYPFHPGLLDRSWQKTAVAALDGATIAWWRLVRRLV